MEAAEAVLAAIPGISSTSARALLGHFGSVAAVLSAGPDEWIKVRGIGPDRVRALQETLHVSHLPHRAD
jgi:ERCC4-type nuclease